MWGYNCSPVYRLKYIPSSFSCIDNMTTQSSNKWPSMRANPTWSVFGCLEQYDLPPGHRDRRADGWNISGFGSDILLCNYPILKLTQDTAQWYIGGGPPASGPHTTTTTLSSPPTMLNSVSWYCDVSNMVIVVSHSSQQTVEALGIKSERKCFDKISFDYKDYLLGSLHTNTV